MNSSDRLAPHTGNMPSLYNATATANSSITTSLPPFTTTDMYGEDYYRWSFPFSVILATIESISAFLAVVGNSMVLTVVIRHRGMRTRTNLFLVNLAVADLLVGAAVMPFAITTLIEGDWVFGSRQGGFCTVNGWLNCFCLVASIHTLMYISVHKHYSITQPLGSHFKLRQILGMMAAAWVWAAVSSTITITGLSSVRYKKGTSQCGPEYPQGLKSYVFHGIIQFTNIFIPVVILTYCYTRMFHEIRAHTKRLQQNSTLEQDVILAQQKKVTITLFIVLACFVICAMPFHLYATYTTISKDKHFSPYLNPLAYGSLYLNSALNPIIYAFRSPSFREGYKEILCQTPTYVISDDLATEELQSPIRRRFSFRFSSTRRASATSSFKDYRSSCASLASLGSQGGSPRSLIANHSSSKGGKRPKSMAGLIRASRQSTKQSSIIRQNGDIIIVKAGKIVSIRREQGLRGLDSPSSAPFLHRPPFPRDCTGRGRGVNGLLNGDSAVTARRTWADANRLAIPSRASLASSEGSDSVFDDSTSNIEIPCSADKAVELSSLEIISEEKRLLSQTSSLGYMETNVDCRDCENVKDTVSASNAVDKDAEGRSLTTDVGIIISIDEDNSILNVMPLTPRTRDCITRSDLFLGMEGRDVESSVPKDLKTSHSSQGLCKHPLLRLPSLEHLDPPVRLKRASSDYTVHQGSRGFAHLLRPAPDERRWSFGKKPLEKP